jgi:hypothetical protein
MAVHTPRRLLAGGLIAGALLASGAGFAAAAPGDGAKSGHLVLTVAGEETVTLAPGQAKKRAVAECVEDGLAPVVFDVDSVRAVFPAPFEVCTGVTLTSQVAAEDDDEA